MSYDHKREEMCLSPKQVHPELCCFPFNSYIVYFFVNKEALWIYGRCGCEAEGAVVARSQFYLFVGLLK